MPSYPTEQSDTYSVSIGAPPHLVWKALAQVHNWPHFSPFAREVTATATSDVFAVTTPTGHVRLRCLFDEDRLLLDHQVTLADNTEVFIAYRVVSNHLGAELIMTNVKSPTDSLDEYSEQLRWMRTELDGARDWVEQHLHRDPRQASRAPARHRDVLGSSDEPR